MDICQRVLPGNHHATRHSLSTPVRHCAPILACLLLPLPGAAREPVFLSPAHNAYLRIVYGELETTDLAAGNGDVGGARTFVAGGYRGQDTPWRVALGHEYNALDIELNGAAPDTNGHVHTLHVAGSWTLPAADGRLELTVAPAISASSNAFKEPGELDTDSAQLWASATWQLPSRQWDWVLGLAHDYRFGQARLYPVAGLSWQQDRFFLWATYPDLVARWNFAQPWALAFTVGPDGNEWQAYDQDLERSDDFRREAWQAGLELGYRWRNGLSLKLASHYYWDQRWRMRLEDGGLLRSVAENSAFLGIELGWSRH
jgi:hypothetical protein